MKEITSDEICCYFILGAVIVTFKSLLKTAIINFKEIKKRSCVDKDKFSNFINEHSKNTKTPNSDLEILPVLVEMKSNSDLS